MKRQTFALVVLAAASSAAICVPRAPGAEARRAGKSVAVVDGSEGRAYDAFLPARERGRGGRLNVEGNASHSILARRGPELPRVWVETDAR